MKTLQHKETGEIRRVDDKTANQIAGFPQSIWNFVTKSVWKTNRTTKVVTETLTEEAPKRTKASKKNEEKKQRKSK